LDDRVITAGALLLKAGLRADDLGTSGGRFTREIGLSGSSYVSEFESDCPKDGVESMLPQNKSVNNVLFGMSDNRIIIKSL
jgi:hypothetical protein